MGKRELAAARTLMRQAGARQVRIAKKLGMSRQTLWRKLRGDIGWRDGEEARVWSYLEALVIRARERAR